MHFFLRIQLVLLAILIPALLLIACGTPTQETETAVPVFYDYLIPLTAEQEAVISGTNLTLANKAHPIDESYQVNLTQLPSDAIINHDSIEVESNTAIALLAMIAEMRYDGINDVYVTSGFRSYSYQSGLFNHYCNVEREKHPSWSQEQIEAEVLTYSAKPGTSEHQTGLCIDFMTNTMSDLDNSFERTRAFEWLSENAFRFGFILRYPADQVDTTGYAYESWHYRFVGRDVASVIAHQHITLEDYLIAHTN